MLQPSNREAEKDNISVACLHLHNKVLRARYTLDHHMRQSKIRTERVLYILYVASF